MTAPVIGVHQASQLTISSYVETLKTNYLQPFLLLQKLELESNLTKQTNCLILYRGETIEYVCGGHTRCLVADCKIISVIFQTIPGEAGHVIMLGYLRATIIYTTVTATVTATHLTMARK